MSKGDDIDAIIAGGGIVFGRGGSGKKADDGKVKTKAKKKRFGTTEGEVSRAACQPP